MPGVHGGGPARGRGTKAEVRRRKWGRRNLLRRPAAQWALG
eukprot:gene41187-28421_t